MSDRNQDKLIKSLIEIAEDDFTVVENFDEIEIIDFCEDEIENMPHFLIHQAI